MSPHVWHTHERAVLTHCTRLCNRERRKVVSQLIHGSYTTTEGHFLTNVAILAQAIAPAADQADKDGHVKPQLVYYVSGVGTSFSGIQNVIAGATGISLDDKVEQAYGFLCDNYQPGDELFLFGFSRGAYTARCLGGLINWAGVLSKKETISFGEIWQAYSKRDPTEPETDDAAAQLFFDKIGRWPNREASQAREADGDKPTSKRKAKAASLAEPGASVVPPPIKVIGVWDTVGALGVPGNFSNPLVTKAWQFFDPGLGKTVEHAFHAMALQEDRKDFTPTFWYKQADAPEAQVLRQVWFQGTHTDVGGGYSLHGLSDITLAWMVAQMRDWSSGPLLNIDLRRLRELQDRRTAWAKQPAHQSRLAIEFQATRHIGEQEFSREQLDMVVWKSMVETGSRNESIHHSVVVGGRYDPQKSEQFANLRRTEGGRKQLTDLWNSATDANSLLPTEKLLRWGEAEASSLEEVDPHITVVSPPQHNSSNGASKIRHGTGSGSQDEPENGQAKYFDGLMKVATLPEKVVASAVNMRVVPSENLKPGFLGKGVESLRRKFYKEPKKDTIEQQVLSEST